MSWFNDHPSPTKQAAEHAEQRLATEREKRKFALSRLIKKIEELPIDDALESIGKDIRGRS